MKLSDIKAGKHYILYEPPHFDDVFLCTNIDAEAVYGRWWLPRKKMYGKTVRIIMFKLAKDSVIIKNCPIERIPDGQYRKDH